MPVPLSRLWFTWSDRPAESVFLPLGLRLTPVLYSARLRRASLIAPREDVVRLGRHAVDGSFAELETELAGTRVGFRAGTVGPFALRGGWEATRLGEWGARFWLTLAVSAEGSAELRHEGGAVLVRVGARHAAVVTREAPILVSGHESLAALAADFEANGYFSLASRADTAPVLGLRFNLDMMRQGAYAAAVADSPEEALAAAQAALAAEPGTPALHSGAGEGALDAVRDITGWNTVWDGANHRAYTKVTRIWNLGEFAVWYNDQCYAALLAGAFDADLARDNLAVAHAGATPQGNVACLVTSHDAWVDRSQPPLGSLIAWMLYQRTGERSVLAAHYEALARNQRWWRAARDPGGTGLVSCGTSDTGAALYKGTHFGARNETGMDNSATHDEAVFDPVTGTLSTWDLGLNCAVALDAEMLAKIAAALGRAEEAAEFAALAEAHRGLIRERLWDPEREIFANRQRGGGFVTALAPTSFYPLLCGAADDAQTAALLRHLDDPRTFASPHPIPNATRDHPAYAENTYWRGRVWPNVNYLTWLGLHRAGLSDRAGRLAESSLALFRRSWAERIAAENYNAETGAALDQGDTDPFYIWAALLPFMAVEEVCGFSPWDGWCLTNGPDVTLGPLLTPLGPATVTRAAGRLRLAAGGAPRLETDFPGRLSALRFEAAGFSCTLSASDRPAALQLPGAEALAAELDGRPIDHRNGAVTLPAGGEGRRFRLWLRGEAPPHPSA